MQTLAAFLVLMAGPLARHVLYALGIGVVTFVGVSTVLTQLINSAKAAYGQIGATAQVFFAMGGVNTALSIIVGAMIARLAFVQLKRLVPV